VGSKVVYSNMTSDESKDQVETRHKREVKALEGEKRAAAKKAKALKGKKGKEAQARYDRESF